MKIEALRKAARTGIERTRKDLRCDGCGSMVRVSLTCVAVGACKRCPERNGWQRMNDNAFTCEDCPEYSKWISDSKKTIAGFLRVETLCESHMLKRQMTWT